MITPKIAANQAFSQLNRVYKQDGQQRQPSAGEGTAKQFAKDAIDGVKANISAYSAHPLQQFNAEFNAVVKSIRIADTAMGEIEANVEQMASEVELFLKQYPPYPPGSDDRVAYLNRFAMLRKQIDKLTIPQDAGARSIIGREDGGSGDWEIEISGHKAGPTIRHQPVHTGEEGLALPEISPDASEEQIAGLQKALGRARRVLKQRRHELTKDATQVIRSAEKML